MNQWEVGLLISSYGLGSLVGGLFFSYISDLSGRKLSLICGLTMTIAWSIACTLFNEFYPILLFRLLSAVGYGGILPVGVTYLTEYLPDNCRGFYLIIMEIFRNLGGVLTIIVGLVCNDNWRYFILAPVTVMGLTLLIIICWLPESSRYLLFKDKTDDVVNLLNMMATQNKRNFMISSCTRDDQEFKTEMDKRNVSIWKDLVWNKWYTTIPLMMIWFFPAFGMGIYVFLPEIMLQLDFTLTDAYLLSTFLLVLPMVGVLITTLVIERFGRKDLIRICTLISGLCLLVFSLTRNTKGILMFYVVLGVFSIFMKVLRGVTYLYTPELYSTSTRTTALGLMSASDRFASILQPMIFASIVYTSFKLAMACYGGCYIVAFLFSLLLNKETSKGPLKESFLANSSDIDIGRSAMATSFISDV